MKNGNVTLWTWAVWPPPAIGKRVLRTMFSSKYMYKHETLCASTKIFVLKWSFGVRRGDLGVKFHDFLKIP